MEIREFRFKNLYGHISGKLVFKTGENFIVGNNGCGKTTVLNFMRYMLCPSFPDLCINYHESAEIKFKHDGSLFVLVSKIKMGEDKKRGTIHQMTLMKEGNEFPILETPLNIDPQDITTSMRKDVYLQYQSLKPFENEVPTWNFLHSELPEPVFVGLDREFGNEMIPGKQDLGEFEFTRRRKSPSGNQSIEAIVRDAFNSFKSEKIKLNTKLNEDILAASFSGVVTSEILGSKTKKEIDLLQIEDLENRINECANPNSDLYIETFGRENVRDAAAQFIDALKSIITEAR